MDVGEVGADIIFLFLFLCRFIPSILHIFTAGIQTEQATTSNAPKSEQIKERTSNTQKNATQRRKKQEKAGRQLAEERRRKFHISEEENDEKAKKERIQLNAIHAPPPASTSQKMRKDEDTFPRPVPITLDQSVNAGLEGKFRLYSRGNGAIWL